MEARDRQDIALDTFIDCGYYTPQILNDAIQSITPDILAEWIDTGRFSPRPNCGHPIVFTVGFILIRGIDSKLYPENPKKMQLELEHLKKQWENAEPESDEKNNLELQYRIKRLAFIAKELGTLFTPLRYNRLNGL